MGTGGVWRVVLPLCACLIAYVSGEVKVSWFIPGKEYARINPESVGE